LMQGALASPPLKRRRVSPGLSVSGFNTQALVTGWPVTWIILTVATRVSGFNESSSRTVALHRPILALAILSLACTPCSGGVRIAFTM
jgi:hypothetical protein